MKQTIGGTVAKWDDKAPLAWEINEETGPRTDRRMTTVSFDLTDLRDGYEDSFLLTLKDLLLERRNQVQIASVYSECKGLQSIFLKIHKQELLDGKVATVDQAFLLSLRTILAEINRGDLYTLKRYFKLYRRSALFASDLVASDFPTKIPDKGYQGEIISRILAKALNRAACVQILGAAEDAWEEDRIDIGHFSFLQLAFHIFARPKSYRHLTLGDLMIDIDKDTNVKSYFLLVTPAKTGIYATEKIPYPLNSRVGELLALQRIHVTRTYGHLVDAADHDRLALFPYRPVGEDGRWKSEHAREHYGRTDVSSFRSGYLNPIRRLHKSIRFDFNALRHTVGTQLATFGCSSKTIQAVLKHANDETCQAYVDIAFHGLIKELSDAMEPAFAAHFPVIENFRSVHDPVDPGKAIRSLDMENGKTELTGECGRRIACQYAPIACYPCPRYIPCYDVDHAVNLKVVEADIKKYEGAGLPYQHLLKTYKEARLFILLVVAASEQYRNALAAKEAR
ncbi:tyrosine-type recombinase/integrase [Sideroxydans sp. CL21]|uniref:tyrosine-type recombinase/integrase n=1 Tax=Sideroxydans sp. CL21 TaxID=2600596 RepID=UPI0024BD033D|nr:tyrosine-type recombinase/integrase [Sideroxydans sp. CL21]